jgi:predicted RNA polymerase sigma factor
VTDDEIADAYCADHPRGREGLRVGQRSIVLTLHVLGDRSVEDLAEGFAVAPDVIRKLLDRAKSRIREMYGRGLPAWRIGSRYRISADAVRAIVNGDL